MNFLRLTYLLLLTVFYSTLYGQNDLINLTANIKDSNVLFADIDNLIKVISPSKKLAKLMARHSRIIKSNDSTYNVLTSEIGRDTLELLLNNKVVHREIFSIEKLSLGTICLGILKNELASKEEIIANRNLFLRNPNSNYSIPYIIRSYKIKILSENISPLDRDISVMGASLNTRAIEIIRRLQKNDTITFTDIIVGIGPSYCPRNFESLSFRIK